MSAYNIFTPWGCNPLEIYGNLWNNFTNGVGCQLDFISLIQKSYLRTKRDIIDPLVSNHRKKTLRKKLERTKIVEKNWRIQLETKNWRRKKPEQNQTENLTKKSPKQKSKNKFQQKIISNKIIRTKI